MSASTSGVKRQAIGGSGLLAAEPPGHQASGWLDGRHAPEPQDGRNSCNGALNLQRPWAGRRTPARPIEASTPRAALPRRAPNLSRPPGQMGELAGGPQRQAWSWSVGFELFGPPPRTPNGDHSLSTCAGPLAPGRPAGDSPGKFPLGRGNPTSPGAPCVPRPGSGRLAASRWTLRLAELQLKLGTLGTALAGRCGPPQPR